MSSSQFCKDFFGIFIKFLQIFCFLSVSGEKAVKIAAEISCKSWIYRLELRFLA
jgi:hypothetical protein